MADSAAGKFCDRQRGAAFGNVCSPSGKPAIPLEKKLVWIWLIGFLSDFIGAALIFVLMLASDWLKLPFNLILFPATTIIAIPGVLLAGVLIFFLNKRFSFQKLQDELSGEQIHKLCLALAIFTAPYAMFIPLYG